MGRASWAVMFLLALAGSTAGCASGERAPTHRATRPAAPVGSKRCAPDHAQAPALARVRTATLDLPGLPDGVATSPDGRWAFASLQGPSGRIVVSSLLSFAPRLVRSIPLPAGPASGLAVTHDGHLLLAAAGRGAVVVSLAGLTQGSSRPVLGVLTAPDRGASAGGGAAEIAVSPDDRFAFVSLERAGSIAVFDLRGAGHGGLGGGFVGTIPVGIAPLGIAISPDGSRVYATSEVSRGRADNSSGTLTVIDLRRAESDPATSVIAVARAPCHPVRVAASPDGRVVWVTARSGNELLGFSVVKLLSRPQHALVAEVGVGAQPIGLGVVDGGRRVIVADSNLLGQFGATARLTVVDADAALRGAPALLGAIRTGRLPSEIAVAPSGKTLLVNNSASGQLEAIDVSQIP